MQFRKFPSIENHHQEKYVTAIRNAGLDDGEWVCTEKAHGSNFSFWFDGKEHRQAKRTGFIEEGEDFVSHHKVVRKYTQSIEAVYKELVNKARITDEIVVFYGELIGGYFYGKNEDSKCVQKGMSYTPDTEFLLFDIRILENIDDDESIEFQKSSWLSYKEMVESIQGSSFVTTPLISKGALKDLLSLKNEFGTRIPELFNLSVPEGQELSQCEGFVIRAFDGEKYLKNRRILIKSKNGDFCEKNGHVVKIKVPKLNHKEPYVPTPEQEELHEQVSTFICLNRLMNVLSKEMPAATKKELFIKKERLAGLLLQDGVDDFNKEQTDKLEEEGSFSLRLVLGSKWKPFSASLRSLSSDIVDQYIRNLEK